MFGFPKKVLSPKEKQEKQMAKFDRLTRFATWFLLFAALVNATLSFFVPVLVGQLLWITSFILLILSVVGSIHNLVVKDHLMLLNLTQNKV